MRRNYGSKISLIARSSYVSSHRLNSSATCRHLPLSLISLHHRPTFRLFNVDTSLPRTEQYDFASKHYNSRHCTRRSSKGLSFESSSLLDHSILLFLSAALPRIEPHNFVSNTLFSRILEYFTSNCCTYSLAFRSADASYHPEMLMSLCSC